MRLAKPLWIIFTLLLLVLSACGGGEISPATSVDTEAIQTAAVQTFIVQLTRAAPTLTLTPVATATETLTPTLELTVTPSATNTASLAVGCDDAAWVSDVTIPDGYDKLTPGQDFTKTWLVKNIGTCTWTTTYKPIFGYGTLVGGQGLNLTRDVAPGETIQVSAVLKAPTQPGDYGAYWRLSNAQGYPFGGWLTVLIKIK